MAQKELYKQWDARAIDTIVVNSDALSTINVVSSPHSVITMAARVQGELAEEIMIKEETQFRTLTIGTGLAPYFIPENDKLAAHKVLSVDMTIEVPKGRSVMVRSKFGSVNAMGTYDFFDVALDNGHCRLNGFLGEARLYTINGNIEVRAMSGVSGQADSRYGTAIDSLPRHHRRLVDARSIYGNILLTPSQ